MNLDLLKCQEKEGTCNKPHVWRCIRCHGLFCRFHSVSSELGPFALCYPCAELSDAKCLICDGDDHVRRCVGCFRGLCRRCRFSVSLCFYCLGVMEQKRTFDALCRAYYDFKKTSEETTDGLKFLLEVLTKKFQRAEMDRELDQEFDEPGPVLQPTRDLIRKRKKQIDVSSRLKRLILTDDRKKEKNRDRELSPESRKKK